MGDQCLGVEGKGEGRGAMGMSNPHIDSPAKATLYNAEGHAVRRWDTADVEAALTADRNFPAGWRVGVEVFDSRAGLT